MKPKWLIAGALALAELGLCGAIVYVSWGGIGAARNAGLSFRYFELDNFSATADEEHRAAVSGPASLQVDNRNGDITITAGSADEMVITAHKTAWGPSQAEAEAQLETLRVVVTQTGDAVVVRVEQPEEIVLAGSQRPNSVNFVISAPPATAVTVHTAFGAVTLSGVERDADLQSSNGPITVTDVAGDLNLDSSFGDIAVERAAAGQVAIHSANGQIRLREVEAEQDVRLTSSFGNLRFEAGRAAALDLETDNGAIVLDNLDVTGPAVLRSSFGSLTLTGVTAGSYDLHSDNGDISVDGASGRLQIGGGFGDIGITNGDGVTLALETSNGRIDFAGTLADGPHTVSSDFGDIVLKLPADAALTVDLETGFGQINTELPITIAGDAGESHLRGTMNGGGPNLSVSTDNGSITLGLLGS